MAVVWQADTVIEGYWCLCWCWRWLCCTGAATFGEGGGDHSSSRAVGLGSDSFMSLVEGHFMSLVAFSICRDMVESMVIGLVHDCNNS